MFLGAKKPPTVVRKVSVAVKKEEPKPSPSQSHSSKPSNRAPSRKSSIQQVHRTKNNDGRRVSLPQATAGAERHNASKTSRQHLGPPTPGLKRKTRSPSAPQWGSDSEEEDDETATDMLNRKRLRSSSREPGSAVDLNRTIFGVRNLTLEKDESLDIIHSADIVSGDYAKEYRNDVFDQNPPTENTPVVRLQYPGNYPMERFALLQSKESQGYTPIQDLIDAVDIICRYYFPRKQAENFTNDITGFKRRLTRAKTQRNYEQFKSIVDEFNNAVRHALDDGTLLETINAIKSLPLILIERILDQIYSRTVSPQVNTLSKYENGTSNVYGELLPSFSHMIFAETGLKSNQVFVDLGSGVGNVVLQAALEIGCESWGIEQMPNPARLGQQQVSEFEARCKRWSITHGKVNLIEGDFLENSDINEVISRADVILINNQVFTPELNNDITMKFLDVKEGAKIVSLKSFVPEDWKIKHRNLNDLRNKLRTVKKQYWSKSVSWTDIGGDYFIATVDSTIIQQFRSRRTAL
jgi:H3 lysine-79-specific histone-lysine N-methyltransferase